VEVVLSEAGDLETLSEALRCSGETSAQILSQGRIRVYPAKSHLVRHGDRSTTAFLLILGRAHALLYTPDGQTILLHEYGSGDLFGALVGIGPAAEDADVVAIDDVRSFLLEAAALASLAERHACIGLALTRLLVKRLRMTATRMYERSALSATGRVCAELWRLACEAEDYAIRPAPVIAELALRAATTRETASRTVNALERRGIIRRDADALVVIAPHRLQAEII
jgi:CRP-like cAMP-binding protein